MSAILNFVPREDRAAKENFDQFVAFCKSKLSVFGHDLDFDKDVWDITSHVSIRGAEAKVVRLHFSSFDSRQAKVPQPMRPDIGAFAKSYIRYMQGLSPIVGFGPRLAALRMLDKAWAEVGGVRGLDELNGLILNRAAQIATDNFGADAAYRVGQQLEMIASFLIDMRLVTGNFTWRNPMSRPRDTQRVGAEFDARRFSKLPSDAAMSALPQIFRSAITPADVIFSAITAILCAAPSRISEVLTLPLDCEVNLPARDGTLTKYGLRWWPAKGAPPMTKFVVGAMSEVVAEAILRIRRMTDHARAVAKWYETHPNQLYLAEELEWLRTLSHVSLDEVASIVGLDGSASAFTWCRTNRVEYSGKRGERNVPLASVSSAIISMLPEGFPYIDRGRALKYSEALFVVLRNQIGAQRGTYRGMIEALSANQFNTWLGGRVRWGFSSVFERLGYVEPNGTDIHVTSHQFRHYLNTLAQAGGLSQLEIAKWSGRRDVSQNAAYDHTSAEDMLQRFRAAVGDPQKMFGPLAIAPKRALIARDEFAILSVPTAHTTDVGYCIHDYTMSPCTLHRDCFNCSELVCVKGDAVRTELLRQRLHEARVLRDKALVDSSGGSLGADRWLVHHMSTVERMEQLCAILSDPNTPNGALVQLSPPKEPVNEDESRQISAQKMRLASSRRVGGK